MGRLHYVAFFGGMGHGRISFRNPRRPDRPNKNNGPHDPHVLPIACTGLSSFANSIPFYAAARFLTGMGVGGEFAAGAALVAETFPDRSRTMALGLLQALSTVGNMMAAIITLIIGDPEIPPVFLGRSWSGWRIAFLVGALPALLVLWIRVSVKEPEAWRSQRAMGHTAEGKKLGNIFELISNPVLRRRAFAGFLIATAGVGRTLWGVGNFSVDLVVSKLQLQHLSGQEINRFKSIMFFLQQAGAFIGIYLFALAAEPLSAAASHSSSPSA